MSDHARVLFFATLRDKAGVREATVEFTPGAQIADIKDIVLEKFPALKQSMETIIVAMNHEFASDETIVPDGTEIAMFPPVSGGGEVSESQSTFVDLVTDEIDINTLLERITTNSTGAACVFTGVVRGITRRGLPHRTDKLEYEAYYDMAISKMQQIAGEIRSRWQDVEAIAMVQRTGMLKPGTISVVIVCTSSHRDSGIFEATHYGINRLKEIVPIWKKETSDQGEAWVEGDYFPRPGE